MTTAKKLLLVFRDGMPVDARLWTEDDWRDLHEAIEQVKAKVVARHQQSTAAFTLVEQHIHGEPYGLHIVRVATGEIVGKYYPCSRETAERHLRDWNEGKRR